MKKNLSIGIIGSGFSGICAAVQVQKQLGIKAEILEKGSDVGGTWHVNTYPGCACDVPSHVYSLSFELNPNWSRFQSPSQEIAAYLRNVYRKYGLYEQTRFNTEVLSAHWMEEEKQWKLIVRKVEWNAKGEVTYGETEELYYNILFGAVGPLMVPHKPKMFEGFQGPTIHTAKWDPSVNLEGKRVAIVGSGSSEDQPGLDQSQAEIIVKEERDYSHGSPFLCGCTDVSCIVWYALFNEAHQIGVISLTIAFLFQLEMRIGIFNKPEKYNQVAQKRFTAYMTSTLTRLNRKDLIDKLIPDYPVGCKRIAYSSTYLEALARQNVVVERSSISQVKDHSIVAENGEEHEFDVLVLATGFITQDFMGPLQVYGQNGLSLKKYWNETGFPKTYKTITVNQFPNLFVVLGPGSGLGHNSVVIMAECQVNYAIQVIKERAEGFSQHLSKELDKTVWASNCMSWYQNAMGKASSRWSPCCGANQ
ncbi:hypothetical protein NQZ79_g2989 [Umbelopsis isabellina]|nr:hypothetical protein NQZ79_g2989 [Umbelopsis isabellina]